MESKKTLKLFVGGKFVRSESGRTFKHGKHNLPLASRKDLRDAVQAARKSQQSWQDITAYNRGQIIYRLSEMFERHELGIAENERTQCRDIIVHFAGWTDKFSAVLSSVNPVAGNIHNFTVLEPCGVAGVIVDSKATLADVVLATIAPLAAGCSVVAIAPNGSGCAAAEFAEVFANSDFPAGVINILTGSESELAQHLSEHVEVDCLDVSGAEEADKLTINAAATIKRVHRWEKRAEQFPDIDTLVRLEAYTEPKTVWHPAGW